MTFGGALALGFALGLRHAADADHVAAVSTIVARTRRLGAAWLLGAVWGLGHSLTIFLAGGLIVLGRLSISPAQEASLEAGVGALLVALGAWTLVRPGAGAVIHEHDGRVHAHPASDGWLRRALAAAGARQLAGSLAVGLLHGLAGSAAAALLVLATLPSPGAGLAYLAVFGLGTLAGMLLLSAALELSVLAFARWTGGPRALTLATGLFSVGYGLRLLWAR